jgi:hypothetical protein
LKQHELAAQSDLAVNLQNDYPYVDLPSKQKELIVLVELTNLCFKYVTVLNLLEDVATLIKGPQGFAKQFRVSENNRFTSDNNRTLYW